MTRGLDSEGNSANFAVTEHIITRQVSDSKIWCSSFVQTRGSIPLVWSSKPNLHIKPDLVINTNMNHQISTMRLHIQELKE